MAKTVKVTSAQVHAARLKIKRSTSSGKQVLPSATAIANARKAPAAELESRRSG